MEPSREAPCERCGRMEARARGWKRVAEWIHEAHLIDQNKIAEAEKRAIRAEVECERLRMRLAAEEDE